MEDKSEAGKYGNNNCGQLTILTAQDHEDLNLKYLIVGKENEILLKALDISENCVTPKQKTSSCLLIVNEEGTPLLKVFHKVEPWSVRICSPVGILIGETISEFKLRCCSFRYKYTLLSRFGKQLLILKGKPRYFPPAIVIEIRTGENTVKKELGRMILAIPLSSRMAMKVTFLPTAEVSENIRNLVVGVAIGIMKSKDIKSNSQN